MVLRGIILTQLYFRLPEADCGAHPHHQGQLQVEGRRPRLLRLRQRAPSQRQLPSNLLLRRHVDAELFFSLSFTSSPSVAYAYLSVREQPSKAELRHVQNIRTQGFGNGNRSKFGRFAN